MKRLVIGISGASCSGKSWLARQLYNISPTNVCIFELDRYYKTMDYVKNLEFQHDNPNAIDYERAIGDFEKLMNGKEICSPIYDYKIHKVIGQNVSNPAHVLIVEGLFAFVDERFRNLMDFRIWVESQDVIKFKRRINRDVTERGDNPSDAKKRYEENVVPAFSKYIKQYKKYADFVYNNDNKSNASVFQSLVINQLNN